MAKERCHVNKLRQKVANLRCYVGDSVLGLAERARPLDQQLHRAPDEGEDVRLDLHKSVDGVGVKSHPLEILLNLGEVAEMARPGLLCLDGLGESVYLVDRCCL